MKTNSTIMSKLLEISENSYFRWKKKDHVILIKLLEKYFTKEDLMEFLNTNKIDKFEKFNFLDLIKEKNRKKYLTLFLNEFRYVNLPAAHDIFIDFYFSFLVFLKSQSYDSSVDILLQRYTVDYSLAHCQLFITENFKEFKQFQETHALEDIDNYKLIKDVNNSVEDLVFRLQKHFSIFRYWDDYMFLFLKDIMDDDMSELYNLKDDEQTRKEALYHIIGYCIYSHDSDKLKSGGKLRLIDSIYDDLEFSIFKNKKDLLKKINDLQLKYLKVVQSNGVFNIELS